MPRNLTAAMACTETGNHISSTEANWTVTWRSLIQKEGVLTGTLPDAVRLGIHPDVAE